MTLIHNPGNVSEVFGDDGKRLAVFVGPDAREKANAFFWRQGKSVCSCGKSLGENSRSRICDDCRDEDRRLREMEAACGA